MHLEVASSFNKDIAKLKDRKLLLALKAALVLIESSSNLSDIPQLKKLVGTTHYYRMRISDYRMGINFDDGKVTIVRFLHRKEIYRYFP